MNLLKRILKSIFVLLSILISSNTRVKAFIYDSQVSASIVIQLGDWQIEIPPWESDYNLNIWENESNLNQFIPENTIFSYDGLLYIIIEGQDYNPYYNDLPGQTSNRWAIVAIELEWRPNTNYRVNSVVVRNDRWFIANYAYNTIDWFIGDPLSSGNNSWSEWREIEPLTQENFNYFEGTTIKDYRIDSSNVTYK